MKAVAWEITEGSVESVSPKAVRECLAVRRTFKTDPLPIPNYGATVSHPDTP